MPQAKQPLKGSAQDLLVLVSDGVSLNRIQLKYTTLVLIEACIQQPIAIRICLADIHFLQRILKSKRENSHIFLLT